MHDTTASTLPLPELARRLDNARRLLAMRVHIDDGRALSAEAIREMSDFRRSIMHMKPEVDLARDHENFARFVSRSPVAMRARDRDGVLRGTFVSRWLDGARDGRRWRLLLPEYGFFHESLRGSGAMPYAMLRAILSTPSLFVGRDVYLGGVGYPTGVLSVDGVFGPARFFADPGLDPFSRELLEIVRDEIAGDRFDPATGRVTMPTRPPRPSPRWFARMASRETFARYESLCPEWLDGVALPVLFRLEPRRVTETVRRALGRSLRRRWETERA